MSLNKNISVFFSVGLKMNLLDPSLAIDLQYLGVRLPLPPPGVSLEPLTQELPPPPGLYLHTDTQLEIKMEVLPLVAA